MAFVIVQHLDPHHTSQLPKLLSKATAMPLIELTETKSMARLSPWSILREGKTAMPVKRHAAHNKLAAKMRNGGPGATAKLRHRLAHLRAN